MQAPLHDGMWGLLFYPNEDVFFGKRTFLRMKFIGKRTFLRVKFIGKRTFFKKKCYICSVKILILCYIEKLRQRLNNIYHQNLKE